MLSTILKGLDNKPKESHADRRLREDWSSLAAKALSYTRDSPKRIARRMHSRHNEAKGTSTSTDTHEKINPSAHKSKDPRSFCNHRNFPRRVCPISNDHPLYELELLSYSPSPLLRWTVQRYKCNSDFQHYRVSARQHFVLLHNSQVRSHHNLQWREWSPSHPMAVPELGQFMHQLMRCLDESFFFGTLTKSYGGRRSGMVRLVLDNDTMPFNRLGQSAPRRTNWQKSRPPYVTMTIYTRVSSGRSLGPQHHSLPSMVQTLVHEMVHAYLQLFACVAQRDRCGENILNTIGLTGHSETFKALETVIVQEICTWDASLRDLRSDRTLGSGCDYDKISNDYEVEEQTKQQQRSLRRGLRSKRKLARNRVVRFSEAGKLLVSLGPRGEKREQATKARVCRKGRMRRCASSGRAANHVSTLEDLDEEVDSTDKKGEESALT